MLRALMHRRAVVAATAAAATAAAAVAVPAVAVVAAAAAAAVVAREVVMVLPAMGVMAAPVLAMAAAVATAVETAAIVDVVVVAVAATAPKYSMKIHNHITTPVVLLIALLVAVALAGWGYYFVSHNLSTSQYSDKKSVFSVLIAENPAFKEADTLMQAGNLEAARAKYLGALYSIRDSFQEAYIKYWIANIDETLGDYPLAIREFKEVANTSISYNLLRAYAVVRVGLIYDLYGDSKNRASMITETFTGEPYAYLSCWSK